MSKKTLSCMLVGCALAFSLFAGTASAADKITVRMGTSTQTSMPACAAAEKFAKEIARKTDGRIIIDFFPARQLGDDTELAEQIMSGTLETALVSTPIFSGYTPLLDTLQVPFLLNTYEKEFKALNSKEIEAIYEGLEELGFKTLAIYEYGIRHLANNVRAVEKPEDLKGLKLRVVPSHIILAAITAMGGNPTPMAYGEVYTALQNKVVDGEEINFTSVASEKHYEVIKYMSRVGLWPFPGALVVNMDFYDKLSDGDKKIFHETAKECLQYNMDLLAAAEAKSVELINGAGGLVNEIKNPQPFIDATRNIRDEYAKKDPRMAAFIKMAEGL